MSTHVSGRPALYVCAGWLFLSSAAWAQSPARISFRAISDTGQPVLDLKASDLSLKLDGKPRQVRALDLVRIGAASGEPAPARPAFASNATADAGRDVILVLDDESIAPGREQPVQVALRQIVKTLAPADRVGFLSLRSGGASLAATTDRAVIATAIDDFRGQAQTSESPGDLQCRTSQILESVKGLLESATDAKTTLVIVSSGIAPLPVEQIRTSLGTSSGTCQLRPSHFSDVGQAAQGSPAALYVLHTVDVRPNVTSDALAGLESLAGTTDATLIRLTGRTAANLDRIAQDTAVYYVASFDVEPGERNGSAHKAEVRATRAGVKIDAGTSLVLAKAGSNDPKDMVRSAEAFRDLPLRATGWAMRDAGHKLKVIALVEPIDAGVKLASVTIALVDGNRIVARWTAQAGELERAPVLAALLAPEGNYRLRAAAVDAAGRAGAVDYPLEARLTPAGPITMSALTLGVPENGFKPRVRFGPADQGAMGYLELYGVPKGATVTGSIELALSETAPAMGTTPATVQASSAEDMHKVVGGFGIGTLQPGDYVMRMIISIDGTVVGTAMRTLNKGK